MGVEASSGESSASPRRSRVGSVRTALRKALADRRREPGWEPGLEVSAAVALRFAEQVDQAEETAELLKASEQLAGLLVVLGLTPGRGVSPGDGSGRGPDERARLHAVMDGPPQVGDAANA